MTCPAIMFHTPTTPDRADQPRRVVCQRPDGHTGAHYASLPGGGVSWPLPAPDAAP